MTVEEMISDGSVFLIDKPLHWTSFDVVAKIRNASKRALDMKKYKVGHAGTLDPLATGLLIICTGRKTKSIDQFQDLDKEYTGTITLGATRPSFDMETEIDQHYDYSHVTADMMASAVQQLSGQVMQEVPIFSAIKVDGKRLYTLARKGETVKLKRRQIEVKTFEIETADFPEVHFRIVCSKGTYIRAIANDFGQILGCGGYLSALRRTKIGDYSVDNAKEINQMIEDIKRIAPERFLK